MPWGSATSIARRPEPTGKVRGVTTLNAAGFHQMRHTTAVADEDWDHDLAVNLSGPPICAAPPSTAWWG